ncbi:MAG: hypothetical protein WCB15_01320, partial [Desulfobacterales bacterium]
FIGKQIARRLILEAVRFGYSTMVLDTLDRLEAGINLYKSLGFVLGVMPRDAYNHDRPHYTFG